MKRISRKILLPLCSQPTHYHHLPQDEATVLGTVLVCPCPDTNAHSYLPLLASVISCSSILYTVFPNLIYLPDRLYSLPQSTKCIIFYVLLNVVHNIFFWIIRQKLISEILSVTFFFSCTNSVRFWY